MATSPFCTEKVGQFGVQRKEDVCFNNMSPGLYCSVLLWRPRPYLCVAMGHQGCTVACCCGDQGCTYMLL